MEEAARRVPDVPAPNALIATDSDARLWPSVKVGERIPDEIISRHRAFRAQHLIRRDAAREARADELIAADDEWRQARRQAKVDSGAWAAVERQEELYGREIEALVDIANAPAQTIRGVRPSSRS